MFSLSPEDDDGAFSGPAGGGSSKLASLFGHDRASFSGGNESLTYTAPKQPKKEKSSEAKQGDAPAVVFATAVHAYKFVDNQYKNQGKLGAAVLANHATSEYKILLYAAKQQQVAIAKVYNQFPFTIQANNYASFCDDNRQRWSICFDSAKNASQFAKQIGLAVYNLQPGSLCTQDLVLGDSQPVDVGDGVEVKYTGWLWTNSTFGKIFDSNAETEKTFKFRTGKGKVIKGWDQGVIGMKKGGKRLIGIPPSLAYGEKGVGGGRVPPNSSLLFEVEVLRIKSKDNENGESKDNSRTQSPINIPEPKETPSPMASLPNITSEPSGVKKRTESSSSISSIKGRTASLNEQLSQSPGKNTDKAKLLARMSKMGGKSVLSSGAPTVADIENDEDDNEGSPTMSSPTPDDEPTEIPASPTSPSPRTIPEQNHDNPRHNPRVKPHIPQRPIPVQPHPPEVHTTGYPAQQVALYQPPQTTMPLNYPMMQQPQAPYYQQPPFPAQSFQQAQPPPQAPPPQQTANDALVPVLMAETRQQQSEVRLAIGKVSDKVDEVLNKVGELQRGSGSLVPTGPGSGLTGNSSTILEASVLLHNITRIVQENEKLKTSDHEKSMKIESLSEKIAELLHKNQQFLEKSNVMLEQSSNSLQHNSAQSQARVLSLEQEKITQTAELTELKTRINEAETQVAILRKQESEMKSQANKASLQVAKYQEELEHVKELHEEKVSEASKLKQDLKEEKQTRKRVESKAERVEEEIADLRHEKESLEKSVTERKRKQTQDKRRFEEELEELRNQHEEEIQKLKDRHRREMKAGDPSADKIAALESEIEERWSEKSAKMIANCEQKWKRKYDDTVEEKDELSRKVGELNEKNSEIKVSQEEKEELLQRLQSRIEDLLSEKDKISRSKGDNDAEISKLKDTIEELREFESKYNDISCKVRQMKETFEAEKIQEYRRGLSEGKNQDEKTPGRDDIANEVKKIMNNMFYMLRGEFNSSESYEGKQIMAVILRVIKEVTLKQVANSKQTDEADDDEEEDEESEEETEEEEEESEEEDDDEEEENTLDVKKEEKKVQEEDDDEEKKVQKEDDDEEEEEEEDEEEEEESKDLDKDEIQDSVEENVEEEKQNYDEEIPRIKEEQKVSYNSDEEEENNTRNQEHFSENHNLHNKEQLESEISQTVTNEESDGLQESMTAISESDEESDSIGGPPPFEESSEIERDDVSINNQGPALQQQDANNKKEPAVKSLDSIFGDDGHDDVEATFGPITKKPDPIEEPSSKPVPPPLFDDDEEDDIDWFK